MLTLSFNRLPIMQACSSQVFNTNASPLTVLERVNNCMLNIRSTTHRMAYCQGGYAIGATNF